jgi:spore coat polysaccharide biosynthesis predicted glycosyltransferase SpsG
MRCLALAEGLRPYATDVHFVCRKLPGDLCRLIERKGFRCTLLPVEPAVEAEFPVDEAGADLPLDQAIDARQTASKTDTVDWLIVDHYEIDHRWEQAMRSICSRLLVIDDLANRSHDCDILLDQTYNLWPAGRSIRLACREELQHPGRYRIRPAAARICRKAGRCSRSKEPG